MKPFKPPLIPKLSKSPKKITSIDEFLRNLLFDLNMLNDKKENNTARNVIDDRCSSAKLLSNQNIEAI